MLTLPADGPSLDVSLLYDINDLAKSAPGWADRTVSWAGAYGIPLGLVLLCLIAWLRARHRPDAPVHVAAVAWAPLAAGLAETLNIPIRALIARPSPVVAHSSVDVLAGSSGFSFASDHATIAMAVAVALLLVSRWIGAMALLLALMEGFCRLYMGVHYPTDVLAGYALGTAVVLLLAPVATALLVPLCRSATGTAAAPLVAALRRREEQTWEDRSEEIRDDGRPGSGMAA